MSGRWLTHWNLVINTGWLVSTETVNFVSLESQCFMRYIQYISNVDGTNVDCLSWPRQVASNQQILPSITGSISICPPELIYWSLKMRVSLCCSRHQPRLKNLISEVKVFSFYCIPSHYIFVDGKAPESCHLTLTLPVATYENYSWKQPRPEGVC